MDEISKPLGEAIRQLDTWRIHWRAEKQQCNEWQSALHTDGGLVQLNSAFANAKDIIDKVLGIVNLELDSALTVQSKAGNIQSKMFFFNAELEALISAARSGVRVNISPPMFSSLYFS